MKWETLRAHIQLFIEKSAEVPFSMDHVDLTSPEGQQEAVRYLLVCGHIPFTVDNLKFLKDKEFHINADQLPETLRNQVLVLAMAEGCGEVGGTWDYVEEEEIKELKVISDKLSCVRVKDCKVVEAGIDRVREIAVSTRYDVRITKQIED